MKRRVVRWASAAMVALAVGACEDSGGRQPVAQVRQTRPQEVQYAMAGLDEFQQIALSRFAHENMAGGVVPDVAMVVSPQPESIPPGKLLVGVQYDDCDTLGRATVVDETLVIEKTARQRQPGTACAGTGLAVGIIVSLPEGTAIKAARLEHVTA